MNQNGEERLRENRQKYQGNVLLGFGRGRGLFSVLVLTLYKFFTRKNPKESSRKPERSPDEFEKIG